MPEESFLITCPNPKCKKKIEDPILVTIQSVKPPKQYDACPYCFAELENQITIENEKMDSRIEEDIKTEQMHPETELTEKIILNNENNSRPKFLKKIKSLIDNNDHSKKSVKKETKKEISDKKEKDSSECPENFGYLAKRPKESPIPQVCLSCPKMVDCMLSPRD